jgi:hypothetical protein
MRKSSDWVMFGIAAGVSAALAVLFAAGVMPEVHYATPANPPWVAAIAFALLAVGCGAWAVWKRDGVFGAFGAIFAITAAAAHFNMLLVRTYVFSGASNGAAAAVMAVIAVVALAGWYLARRWSIRASSNSSTTRGSSDSTRRG